MDSQFDNFGPNQHPLPPRVDRARAQLLFGRGSFSTVAGVALALLMATIGSQHLSTTVVLTWLIPKLITASARVLTSTYLQTKQDEAHVWLRGFAVVAALDGLAWGCSALWLLHGLPPDRAGVLVAALVGVASTGVFVMSASMRASLGFAVPVLLPAMVIALWPDSSLLWYMAPGLSLYLVVLVIEARRMRAQLVSALRLRQSLEAVSRDRAAAQDAALALSHVRDQFVTTLSEQMRSPVAGIVGITRSLMRRPALAHGVDSSRLRLVEHSGEHVLKLIDDVLDYSRFSSGAVPLARAPFNLAQVVDDLAQLIAVATTERNIAFEVMPNGGLLNNDRPYMVRGDAVRVRQVLEHLMSHVLRSISAGEITLSLTHDRSTGLLDMSVSSHGTEVPSVVTQTHHALNPAHHSDAASQVLGLGLSRAYARAMNGEVSIHHEDNKVLTLLLQLELPMA